MFCEKCGGNIAKDSVYCSYCGVTVEQPEPITATEQARRDAECIRPYMPKKHCTQCQKELPGSSISDVCAMCTIRVRNRELEDRRKSDSQTASKRDRYDMSDQFDQSIFKKSETPSYREDTEDRLHEKAVGRVYTSSPAPNRSSNNRGCLIGLIIAGGLLLMLLILVFIGSSLFSDTAENEVCTEAAGETIIYDESVPEEKTSAVPLSDDRSFIEVIQEDILPPIVTDELTLQLGTDVSLEYLNVTTDGVYLYSTGYAEHLSSDNAVVKMPFEVCTVLSESYYLNLYVAVNGKILYDRRNEVDTDGLLTEIGIQNYDGAVGDSVFGDETALSPDDTM